MSAPNPKRALLSVSNQHGLPELARALVNHKFQLLATRSTAQLLREHNLPVSSVEDETQLEPILDDRVKTLHPVIHAGILADPQNPQHLNDLKTLGAQPFQILAVNFYPFTENPAVETIDVGGPSMLRGAAKNHAHVAAASDPDDYPEIIRALNEHGEVPLALRRELAARAFHRLSLYDAYVARWLAHEEPPTFQNPLAFPSSYLRTPLRYGENPHQRSALLRLPNGGGIAHASLLQGKPPGYNTFLDADAASRLINEFPKQHACVIIKHNTPCGAAVAPTNADAFARARDADPLSAFGGVVAFSHPINTDDADALRSLFIDTLIIPDASDEARSILSSRPNMRVFLIGDVIHKNAPDIRSVSGGILIQTPDAQPVNPDSWTLAAGSPPSADALNDLAFAMRVCRRSRSNAVVIASNQQTLGIGSGAVSRVGAAELAIRAAKSHNHSFSNAVAASDAFFPFPDGLEILAEAGIRAVAAPGGSKRDDVVVKAAERLKCALLHAPLRAFRHLTPALT